MHRIQSSLFANAAEQFHTRPLSILSVWLLQAIALLFCSVGWMNSASGEFINVFNFPPTEFESWRSFYSNTQVNLYPGGLLSSNNSIGSRREAQDNIEINLLGGQIGTRERNYHSLGGSLTQPSVTNLRVNLEEGIFWGSIQASTGAFVTVGNAIVTREIDVEDGSLIVMSGGEVLEGLSASGGSSVHLSGGIVGGEFHSELEVSEGSTLLMTGGVVHREIAVRNSYASITGGIIDGGLTSHGDIDIAGGSFGVIRAYGNASTTLIGGNFRLDGTPVTLEDGQSQVIDFPKDSVLTGVLADGSPIVLSNRSDIQSQQDRFWDDKITLHQMPIPTSEPGVVSVPADQIPNGLREGQSLTLPPGVLAPNNFTALPGSTVVIDGGEIGHRFKAASASVQLSAGKIGGTSVIYEDTDLTMSGGEIGHYFLAAAGSDLNILGGSVKSNFIAKQGSKVYYAGGSLGVSSTAEVGSSFTIAGGDFKINGAPVAGPGPVGTTQPIDLPESAVLSGTLSDGTPFVVGSNLHTFEEGTLILESAAVPAVGPALIQVPDAPAPRGIRSGQTLLLADGGTLGDDFTAGVASVLSMSGGSIGDGLRATESLVNITGGDVGRTDALYGSVVNLRGGTLRHLTTHHGSVFNQRGGEVQGLLRLQQGSRANISGGSTSGSIRLYPSATLDLTAGEIRGEISAYKDSQLNIRGGTTFDEIKATGAQVALSGGRLGDGFTASHEAHVQLQGYDFRIDGEEVFDDSPLYRSFVDVPEGAVLSGVFANGTTFAFSSKDGDQFDPGTLELVRWQFSRQQPQGVLPGESLTLESGTTVGPNFTAGWDSEVTIAGGDVGDNFEAVGAEVTLVDGSIGSNMDVLFGSELTIQGGTIGRGLEAHRGSVVNISGGTLEDVIVRAGSVVTITGGASGEDRDGERIVRRVYLESGGQLTVIATDFAIHPHLMEELQPGESVTVDLDEYVFGAVTATLLDGSTFYASVDNRPSNVEDWQRSGPRYLTIKMAGSSVSTVPEPSSFSLIAVLLMLACERCRLRASH